MDDQIRPRPPKPVVSPAVGADGSRKWQCTLRPPLPGDPNPVGVASSVEESYRYWRAARQALEASGRVKPWQ